MTTIAMNLDSAFQVTLPPRPYPGLRPFEKDEWPIFFGRERMADAVVSQLIDKRVLVVHGDSGCGKSSLVRAAVLPRLEQENARGGIRWLTCAATPGEQPLWNLAEALASLGGSPASSERTLEIRRALNLGSRAPDALAGLVRDGVDDHVCILVDQFEELFAHARRHGSEDAQLLADVLVALHRDPPDGLYAVLTMRSEFLGACARFTGFAETVNATQYLVPRMGHDDLLRAIREPAVLFDGAIARDLAERLIADAGGGQDQLPLIQHGLMLLHHHHAPRAADRSGQSWELGLEHYKRTGGLARLLSDHADSIMVDAQATLPRDTRIVEDLFRALTDINADGQAVRRPCTIGELVAVIGADGTAVRRVVDAFRREGISFLKPYGSEPLEPGDLVDISHEALIRCWRQIADAKDGWLIAEFKSGLIWRALLVQAESFESDPTNVLAPATTDERERWMRRRNAEWAKRYGGGWDRVQKLLHASAAERDRQRAEQEELRRREEAAKLQAQRFKLVGGGLVLLSMLLAIAVYMAYTASQEREEAVTQFAAAQAARDASEAERSRVEALAAEARQEAKVLLEKLNAEPGQAPQTSSKTVQYAAGRLNELATSLSKVGEPNVKADDVAPAASLAPRVYIHITDPDQRDAARAFEARLEADTPFVVPGIELVKASPGRSVLRCFRTDECEGEADRLVKTINGLLRAPTVVLDDASGRYGKSGNARPRHYELWFAPGPITLRSAAAY